MERGKKEEKWLRSANGRDRLYVALWRPEGEPRAIVQIAHGMIEHIGRYEELAEALAARGFLVVGNDHLGHGRSVADASDFGSVTAAAGTDGAGTVLRDLRRVMCAVRREEPELPYFFFGHSMGSFFARAFLAAYGEELDGAIIMGTGEYSIAGLRLLHRGLAWLSARYGADYHSQRLDELFHRMNNRGLRHRRTDSDWLTRDEGRVDAYVSDPLCHYNFSFSGYQMLVGILLRMERAERERLAEYERTRLGRGLPILFLGGSRDPVGAMGRSLPKISRKYRRMGYRNVRQQIFEGDRHELLHELDRERVIRRILESLEEWL